MNAAERHVGLIGHPVGHSISPRFQQAAFDCCQIAARYELWDTDDVGLRERVEQLRGDTFLGANVTIPYKQAVLKLVDVTTAEVQLTGAANTIVNDRGRLMAHNTDVGGFVRALRDQLGYDARGRRVGLFGAGGAARGVIAALAGEAAGSIVVLNRSAGRAQTLVAELGARLNVRLQAGPLDQKVAAQLRGCDMIINCTSVGLAGSTEAASIPVRIDDLPAGAVVVDIVANPLLTPFLAAAAARGHVTLGGLSMLVYQGALAFELWTGLPAPVAVMIAAGRAAMTTGPSAVESAAQGHA